MVSWESVHPEAYGAPAGKRASDDSTVNSDETIFEDANPPQDEEHPICTHRLIAMGHEHAYSKLSTDAATWDDDLDPKTVIPSEMSSLADEVPAKSKGGENGLWGRAAGLVFCAMAAVLRAVSSTLVKVTAGKTSVLYVLLARGVTEMVCGIVCLAVQMVVERRWISPLGPKEIRHLLVVRAVCGSLAIGFFFFCISQLPIGDASAASFTTPIFTALLASCVLGEPWTTVCTLAAMCSLAGVIFIAQPDVLFHHGSIQPHESIVGSATPVVASRVVAVLLALTGALAGGTAYTATRRIGPRVSAVVLVLWISTMITLASTGLIATLAPNDSISSSGDDGFSLYGWLAAVGVIGFGAHWCLNRGLQIGQAGPGAFLINLDVAFAYILQVCVLGRALDQWSLYGALLIVAAASLMIVQKMYAHKEGGEG
ncbi:unnamed protein product [Vitrella brassicaformis CCMP3155]|uniref:EamA domain-containing protein n=1 Tax=Vitrella brassicaformis (strain CCMP3155) TaxID=1169540 RepID=A0A0G4GQV1_VITBC|nr:unnamed protein product [Vitrella brassicaformis CCMP3155]|eukprot:CEM32846.1 unnamed protein product [Vitrella brassicaformis CCMP3155]